MIGASVFVLKNSEVWRVSFPFTTGNAPDISSPGGPQFESDSYKLASFVKTIVGVSGKILTGFFEPNQSHTIQSRPQPRELAKSKL